MEMLSKRMKARKLIDLVIPEGRWRHAVVGKEAGLCQG